MSVPLLAGAFALAACAGVGNAPAVGAERQASRAEPISRHVVLVSVDGLRPDAITPELMPALTRLAREGGRTLTASTVFPSTTLPAHVSMVSGVPPEVHGVTSNLDLVPLEGYAPFPTLFSEVHVGGLTSAAFFGKSKLRYLAAPGTADHVSLPEAEIGAELGAQTMQKVVSFMETARPNLLFVHLADPDYAGHLHGWMGSQYADAVKSADRQITRLLLAADQAFGEGEYTVIVTADHGGHSHDHGSAADLDVVIPWIIWGKGVAPGLELQASIRTIDTAPTVLRILGLPVRDMAGSAVEGALAEP